MYLSRWSSIEFFADNSYFWENNAVFEVFYQIEDYNKFRTSPIWYLDYRNPKEQMMNIFKDICFAYDISKLGENYWYKIL